MEGSLSLISLLHMWHTVFGTEPTCPSGFLMTKEITHLFSY